MEDQESTILEEKHTFSGVNRVTTEQMESVDISNVGNTLEGTNVNTEVQIIEVNSEENGPMIEGEMIELVIPEDGTGVRNFVTIETSKVKDNEI